MERCLLVLSLFQPIIVYPAASKLVPVIEGKRIELEAPSEANSIPSNIIESINWFNDTNQNLKNVLVQLTNPTNGRFSIDKSENSYGDLIIEPTERSDSGPYTCQVKDKNLKLWNITYQLDVYYMDPPEVTGPFRDDNENITFYCDWSNIINPDKTPSVTWNRDEKELNTSRNGYQLKEVETRSTLVILNPSERDVGRYTCNITVDTNKGKMKQTSNAVEFKSNIYKPLPTKVKRTRSETLKYMLIPVFVVLSSVCIISLASYFIDKKYKTSRKYKHDFQFVVDENSSFNEGESAEVVLVYKPKNAKIASVSWFKIAEDEETDHLITFDMGCKRPKTETSRKRFSKLATKRNHGDDRGNIYYSVAFAHEPPQPVPAVAGPSYFVLDDDETKKYGVGEYNYIQYDEMESCKKQKNTNGLERYAITCEEIGSFTLTIDSVKPRDAGVYKFTVLMKNDETHVKTFQMSVKPKLVIHVRDVEVEEGSKAVTFICEIFPKDTVVTTTTWFRKYQNYTEVLASNNDNMIYNNTNPKYKALLDGQQGRGMLIIRNVKVDEGGKYVCTVQREGDDEGDTAHAEGTLSVICNLTVHVYDQEAMVGDKSTFIECRIIPPGEAITGVMWYRYNTKGKFNGNVLASTNDIASPGSKYHTELQEGGRCLLHIKNVIKADGGKYVCKVMRTFQMKLFKGCAVLTVTKASGVKNVL